MVWVMVGVCIGLCVVILVVFVIVLVLEWLVLLVVDYGICWVCFGSWVVCVLWVVLCCFVQVVCELLWVVVISIVLVLVLYGVFNGDWLWCVVGCGQWLLFWVDVIVLVMVFGFVCLVVVSQCCVCNGDFNSVWVN